ncbi:MAG: MFS transporter [Planctomycetota bacterium]|nr:MFS transporter [Planctomycetota bacterium]
MKPVDSMMSAMPILGRNLAGGSRASRNEGARQDVDKSQGNHTKILFVCNFLSKGWEVSILGLLAFVQQQYALHLYMVGILSAVFIVSQISISFFAGQIAHALQSRNVIFLSIAASAGAWLTLSLSSHVSLLYLAYMLGGISSGLFEPIGNSLVAKCSSAKNRGTAIGNFAACGDMGRIAVVAAATALAGLLGVNHACGILFLSALVALILAIIFIPSATGSERPAEEVPVRLAELLQNRNFCFATAAGIADSFSSASLYIFIPFLLSAKGIALANTLYFNVIFFAGYMSGRLALGRLADRYNASHTLIVAQLTMAALLLLLVWVTGMIPTIILLFLLGIFTRGTSPIIRAMVADSLDERISFHNAFSAYAFASRSSSAICRPIYGFLASYAGIGAVFYAASAVSLCTLYPAAKYNSR